MSGTGRTPAAVTEPVGSPPQPRLATPADAAAVTATIAAAFFDDPVIGWVWRDPVRRHQILPDFFALLVADSLVNGEVYTTDDIAGASLWLPPATSEPTAEETAALVAAIETVSHEFAPAALELMEILEDHHPHEPHYYLPVVGTRPERQGRGIGSAVLAPVLQRCDQEGLPAYLEATSARNQALYLRHGFEVTREIGLPDGPTIRAMWREPQGG